MITDHDAEALHCPMLGHEVPFAYCRRPGREIPCRRAGECWGETFDIQSFLQDNYPPEILAQVFAPPPPKMVSLFDLIQEAKKRVADED